MVARLAYPNIHKWGFLRWNTCNIGVGSFSILGGGGGGGGGNASEANFNMREGIAKCAYTHICIHIHMYACMHMHAYIYILSP